MEEYVFDNQKVKNPISYFPNEQGDFTITLHERPVSFVKEETDAAALYNSFNALTLRIDVLQKQLIEYGQTRRDLMDLQRKYENGQKAYTDAHERFNSKIMSVYYLLDTITDCGTHHEKRVVVTHLKYVLQKMIHNGDPLPLNTDLLPF